MATFKFRKYISWGNSYRMIYNYEEEFQHFFTYNTNSGSIMQFTGIKDSKDNEIFELDFIKINDKIYTVVWDFQNVRFVLEDLKGKEKYDNFGQIAVSAEIIGNFAENPELLN